MKKFMLFAFFTIIGLIVSVMGMILYEGIGPLLFYSALLISIIMFLKAIINWDKWYESDKKNI